MYTTDDLVNAIKDNDSPLVDKILESEPVLVNARTDQGVSMVTLATYYGREEIAQQLIRNNAQLDLYDAAVVGDAERATGWLAMQPDLVNTYSPDGYTPLGLASFFGHDEIVGTLLTYHADPNLASNNAMRVAPLHSAVAGDHFSVAAKLVEAGANVNAVQADGFTPLMGAAQNGNLEITRLLLEHKADVNARSDKSSKEFPDMTALAFAQQANAAEVAALLERAGATI